MTFRWTISGLDAIVLDEPRIMAIINITPDSFSDGGEAFGLPQAMVAIERAVTGGAAILDLGGESTRPGAARIPAEEQIRRAVPVIRQARSDGITTPISIDTTLAEVARAALDSGANIINDVSAGSEDPQMLPLAAERTCGIILMHRRSPPAQDVYAHQHTTPPDYPETEGGVYGFVYRYLEERMNAAEQAGVHRSAIVIDPGVGFGKNVEQNVTLARRLKEFESLGSPVLSAVSRKSFIGHLTGIANPKERVAGTLAVSVEHALAGVRLFRVHDVEAHAEAFRIVRSMARK